MEPKDIEKNMLNQLDVLKSKLILITNQLKKDKRKLNDHNLFNELNKNRNFFNEHIISSIEKNINNQSLIKESDDSINIIEGYIKDVENIKKEIVINKKEYNIELLQSMSSSLGKAISSISILCSNSSNKIQKAGKILSYGGQALLGAGIASIFFCPLLTIPLIIGGAAGYAASIPVKALGNAMESIKGKTKKILS